MDLFADYDFEIVYKTGTYNVPADFLYREPCVVDPGEKYEGDFLCLTVDTMEQEGFEVDPILNKVGGYLIFHEGGSSIVFSASMQQYYRQYVMWESNLCRRKESDPKSGCFHPE